MTAATVTSSDFPQENCIEMRLPLNSPLKGGKGLDTSQIPLGGIWDTRPDTYSWSVIGSDAEPTGQTRQAGLLRNCIERNVTSSDAKTSSASYQEAPTCSRYIFNPASSSLEIIGAKTKTDDYTATFISSR